MPPIFYNTSGSASTSGSKPPNPTSSPASPSTSSVQQPKKINRAIFSSMQLMLLEGAFYICPYPDSNAKNELAKDLGLEPVVIKTWLQNRRAKERKNPNKAVFNNMAVLQDQALVKYKQNTALSQ